jgi:Protein of unknown function (DUF1573)
MQVLFNSRLSVKRTLTSQYFSYGRVAGESSVRRRRGGRLTNMPNFVTVLLFLAATAVSFDGTTFSFGKIAQGTPVSHAFTFTNGTDGPATIEIVKPDCPCVTVAYPTFSIAPGKTATVKLTYDARLPGAFVKAASAKFAGITKPFALTVQGEVIPAQK